MKFLDSETGEVILAESVVGSKHGGSEQAVLYGACEDATKKALKRIQAIHPFTAKVIDVDGDIIYIDQGSEAGVHVGDVFEIVKEARPIMKDGRIIAMKYDALGKAKVKQVDAEYAICKITGHSGAITNGALVKRGD